jgi:hypothetical protein
VNEFSQLLKRLRRVEALHARTDVAGERDAAAAALRAIRAELRRLKTEEPPVEYKFTVADVWSRQLLTALLRRYELHPCRYRGQRWTTVMVRVSPSFVDTTLWPTFTDLSDTLQSYLAEITQKVIREAICEDSTEAADRPERTAIVGLRQES